MINYIKSLENIIKQMRSKFTLKVKLTKRIQ